MPRPRPVPGVRSRHQPLVAFALGGRGWGRRGGAGAFPGGRDRATLGFLVPRPQSAMALPGPRPLLLPLLLALALRRAHAETPTVRLIDQEGPILEGSNVTLECLSEGATDMSQFTFQKYSRWLHTWVSLDKPDQLRCWFYRVTVMRPDGRLLLGLGALQSWHAGAYRCVATNSTANDSTSSEFILHMEYLHSIFLSQAHSWCGTVGDSVAVLEGEDLELQCSADASQPPEYEWSRQGEDWVVVGSTLSLRQVRPEQAGTYECRAQLLHLPQLAQRRAVRLHVEGVQRSTWLEPELGLSTPLLLLAVGLPALLLLLLVLGLGLFLLRRHNSAKTPAQEEPSQRTPIYKGSLESLPSVVGDKQPLVL